MLNTLYNSTVVTRNNNVTIYECYCIALFFSQYAYNGPRGTVFSGTTTEIVRNSELIEI